MIQIQGLRNFQEIEMTSNEGIIFATIFGAIVSALIIAAVTLFVHYDSTSNDSSEKDTRVEKARERKDVLKEEVGEAKSNSSDESKENESDVQSNPSIRFAQVFVTPIDTNISSSFFVEISNRGSVPAENFKIDIDFGESKIDECELLPERIVEV